jgi:uncharacterized protein YndB with AHSA1/START domain
MRGRARSAPQARRRSGRRTHRLLLDPPEPESAPGSGVSRHGEKVKDMKALAYSIETVIRRPPQEVFDYCSDLRSELQWNPRVKYVEKLTDGPVGVGTRYRTRWANSGPTTVEVVQFDPPHSWETNAAARGMSIRFQGTVTDTGPGARYSAYLKLHPRAWPGWWRLLPCWPCDARTSRTCTGSGRRSSPARSGRLSRRDSRRGTLSPPGRSGPRSQAACGRLGRSPAAPPRGSVLRHLPHSRRPTGRRLWR